MSGATKEPRATEMELTRLLERRHAGNGNGGSGEYAFLTQVRNDGGFSATRTFDAVAVSLWPSRGYAIDVFEIKVSRSDWLRELKDPAKSEAAWQIGNRFWIVATRGVVQDGELPPGWGLIEAYGGKLTDDGVAGRRLRTVTTAEFKGGKAATCAKGSIPKGFMVAMLRRAGAVPDQETPSERVLKAAEHAGWERGRDQYETMLAEARERDRALHQAVARFSSRAGVAVVPRWAVTQDDIDATADRIRAALADEGHAEQVRNRLAKMREELQRGVDQLDALLTTTEPPTLGRID